MFAYDHNHVAVLVCGRFGRHSTGRAIVLVESLSESGCVNSRDVLLFLRDFNNF